METLTSSTDAVTTSPLTTNRGLGLLSHIITSSANHCWKENITMETILRECIISYSLPCLLCIWTWKDICMYVHPYTYACRYALIFTYINKHTCDSAKWFLLTSLLFVGFVYVIHDQMVPYCVLYFSEHHDKRTKIPLSFY